MRVTHAVGHSDRRPVDLFTAPSTRMGWWSVGLMAAFLGMFLVNAVVFMPSVVVIPYREVILPFYGIAMMGCGLAAGVVGLLAMVRRHERSWLVWFPMLAGLFVVIFVLGEFAVPH